MSAGQVAQVDPKTLLVGPNVRREAKLTPEFLESIRERGVLIPIVVHESTDGLVVEEGQRRTLAAVDAGLALVTVFVKDAASEEDRLIDQIAANLHREGVEESDAVAAVQQLALFDLKVPVIAKKAGLPEGLVERAVLVGGSKVAQKAMKDKQLSFDAAVILAEFDDFPAEQKKLLALDQEWQVRETARSLRQAREEAAVEAQIKAMDGVTFIKEPAGDPKSVFRLYVDEEKTTKLSDLPHEEIVALAGDGLCAYVDWQWVDHVNRAVAAFAVKGWKDRGLFAYESGDGDVVATTPEEIEAAKVERRRVRETTKEWMAASVTRIEWMQGFVQRKAAPKGWEPLVAARMLNNAGSFSTSQLRMMLTILQLPESADSYSLRSVIEKWLEKNPAKAAQVMLAVELGCVEGGAEFDKKGWRGDTWQVNLDYTKAHLTRLEQWGYTLSPVELGVLKAKKVVR